MSKNTDFECSYYGIARYNGKDKHVIIPREIDGTKITIISKSAFKGCSMKSVDIPDSVTSINDSAFENCKELTHVTIPKSVTHTGKYAFRGCDSLKTVDLPDTFETINYGMFSQCTSLKKIEIPDSVHTIWGSSFLLCTSLKSVTIPNSVTRIEKVGGAPFSSCAKLKKVTIPYLYKSSVSYIFPDCPLKKISYTL